MYSRVDAHPGRRDHFSRCPRGTGRGTILPDVITPRLVRNNFFVGGVRNLPKGSSDEVAVGQNVGPNVAGPGIICC